jgi:hypothetical protein
MLHSRSTFGIVPRVPTGKILASALVVLFAASMLAACGGGGGESSGNPNRLVALTTTYRVVYDPGATTATEGKTVFTIGVTNRSTGADVSGAAIGLSPLMHMTGMTHSTPVDDVIVDNGDGTYTATAYFLMATMGSEYWELAIDVNGETATFTPTVGMAMAGNTVRASLKGQSDTIVGSMGMGSEQRTYYVFRDKLEGMAASRTFGVFLAAKETLLDMPALVEGMTLHDAMDVPWTVGSIELQASSDGGATWITGTNSGGARWEFPGLAGLASGTAGHVFVKLTVDGEVKTTDGAAPSGANAYADFTVTPM